MEITDRVAVWIALAIAWLRLILGVFLLIGMIVATVHDQWAQATTYGIILLLMKGRA